MYDVIGSNDMEEMGKVLGDVKKPGAHGYVFCPALHVFVWYQALALEREKRTPVPDCP